MIVKKIFIMVVSVLMLVTNAYSYQVEATPIPSDKYFKTTLAEVNSAKSSINVIMYLISILPEQPNSEPNQLAQALVQAKDRGVMVKVVLDQNIDFESESMDVAAYRNKNQKAFELLIKNKVPVFFDTSTVYTHSKAVVIDNETVILGSTNWSKASLTRNHETNVLIRSKDFAAEILTEINKIPLQENIPASLTPAVPIPAEFVTNKKLLGEMATQSDQRAFDAYLYLQKEYDGNKLEKLTVDYVNLAKFLNIDQMPIEAYRRQINKTLDKLDQKYNLIKFESPTRNQDAQITLKSHASKDQTDKIINIPTTFFRYNWNQILPFNAKAMYLVYSLYSQSSPNGVFTLSREDLSKKHGISESFISNANKTLRENNLIDIQYSSLEDQNYNKRKPNTYLLNDLYDPKDLEKNIKDLEQKEGKEKVKRAQDVATIVFEQNNLQTLKTLIDLENKHGQQTIQEAANKIKDKSTDNPKRSAGYVINIIKSMGSETQTII